MNVEIPFAPRRLPGASVRTMIIIRSAVPPLVAHALRPFSTQPPPDPSRTACACIDAGSEPASGSESANPTSSSPRASGFSQRSFCAGVPCLTSIVVGIAFWILIDTEIAASAAAISSSASRYVTPSTPIPSHASGVHIPRKPSFPSSAITSRGKCLVRSHSAANGSIFVRAKSRASSTIWRCVSLRPGDSTAILMEPPAALAAQTAGGDQLPDQRARAILVVAQVAVQHLEDREAHVEPDQVGERQRPQGMVHPQLHHRVHRLGCRHAFHYAEGRFVDHRQQHAVRYE